MLFEFSKMEHLQGTILSWKVSEVSFVCLRKFRFQLQVFLRLSFMLILLTKSPDLQWTRQHSSRMRTARLPTIRGASHTHAPSQAHTPFTAMHAPHPPSHACSPIMHAPPTVNRMTDRSKTLPRPKLRLRTVIITSCENVPSPHRFTSK